MLIVISGEKYNLGKVVAVGPKVDSVKVGDQIRFGESQETSIGFQKYMEDGQEFLIMQEADVCFVEEINGAEQAEISAALQ